MSVGGMSLMISQRSSKGNASGNSGEIIDGAIVVDGRKAMTVTRRKGMVFLKMLEATDQ